MAQPLEGIRVLDLGQIYQGPYAGFLLGKAGAEVIQNLQVKAMETVALKVLRRDGARVEIDLMDLR